MSNRIQELMEQAQYDDEVFGDGFSGPVIVKRLDPKKFAELIVRECQAQNKIAIQYLKDNPEDIPGWKTFMNLAMVTCNNQIAAHFGIE